MGYSTDHSELAKRGAILALRDSDVAANSRLPNQRPKKMSWESIADSIEKTFGEPIDAATCSRIYKRVNINAADKKDNQAPGHHTNLSNRARRHDPEKLTEKEKDQLIECATKDKAHRCMSLTTIAARCNIKASRQTIYKAFRERRYDRSSKPTELSSGL